MSETKRPHGSRFRDALVIINPGACNRSGVALSIADACREIREHEKRRHQAHLPGPGNPTNGVPARSPSSAWPAPSTSRPLHQRRGRLQGNGSNRELDCAIREFFTVMRESGFSVVIEVISRRLSLTRNP